MFVVFLKKILFTSNYGKYVRKKYKKVKNGDFVVARVDDECTMKKFYKTKSKDGKHDQIILQPCNHDYEPIILNPKSTKVEIVGKVIRALKIL